MACGDLEIVLLIEDTVHKRGFMAEHGLSFWIRYGGDEYLFDTGQGLVLLHNATKMRIDLSKLAGVFLSHGHYDHTGGLKDLLNIVPDLKVYAHPGIFNPKYYQGDNELRETGIDIKRQAVPGFIPVEGVKEIADGIWVINQIPRATGFEEINSNFKVYKVSSGEELSKFGLEDGLSVDDFTDDQSLFIETEKGLVVLVGCSHAGIVNILEYIRKVTEDKDIYAIIGGMHLIDAKEERINRTVDYLADLDFQLLVPLHCTGIGAVNQMINRLGERVRIAYTGDSFSF